VAVLTSSNENADREEAYRLGADSYLVKPSDPDHLVEIIQQLMIRWQQIRR
jgi:DNA-binding NarL/FixJ family response regulator